MDLYTFGKSPCFVRLAEILDEIDSEKITTKVGKLLTYYNSKISALNALSNSNKRYFASLLVNSYIKSVEEKDEFPPILKSHLLTCIKTRYRQHVS